MRYLIVFYFSYIVQYGTATGFDEKSSDFPELTAKYGYTAEEYDVITEDGYILRLFRIKGQRKTPILLMHGILDSANTWVMRGNTSLAITLANKGYDVWIGNCRGNKYGRLHVHLENNSKEFWDYSFHEHGRYDLPAIIDSVLYLSGADKLDAVGHSQGNTIFYVMASLLPEYNSKVNILVALAPVCYLQNVPPPLKTMIQYSPVMYRVASAMRMQDVFGWAGENLFLKLFCQKPIIGYSLCITSTMFPITGDDEEEMDSAMLPILFEHFPMATSVKNLYHYAQVSYRRQFARFDYGPETNLDEYGYPTPINYELDQVTMRVALFVGGNDKVSTIEDVAILKRSLPNVVRYMVMPHRKMNHADFIWGLHMDEYLFPYIFEVLKLYEEE